ncbi:DUF2798 domain-containing protein [Sedimentimonas flavescens]|uniref:DUF2798 domain-containing protein n=1 Tax=Sedimentimonas flavescens TaxID=2851012 RepID=UPI0021A8C370|nr:DUF2798 domain-containing protein [Sedimentimonas flavescens]MCT2538525.1 DUF2798 domain-containing protein [Sedimentimonas flavescens]
MSMNNPDPKREKRTILLAQLFISCMMAFLMTFIFSIFAQGMPAGWSLLWLHHFFTAWPVAFVLSLGVGPIAFRLAYWSMHRLTGPT